CAQDDGGAGPEARGPTGSIAVLDMRHGIAAAAGALDLEAHLVARAQALEHGWIFDVEEAPAALEKLLWDGSGLEHEHAGLSIDRDDAPRRQRLVEGRDLLVSRRLGSVVDLGLTRQRLHRERIAGDENRRNNSEPYWKVCPRHRSTLPRAIW